MSKRRTKDEFIRRAKEIHGDKYDYSKVEYVNNTTKVCIICPVHGEFWQYPNNHINQQQGCAKCFHEGIKKPVYGVGINDTDYVFESKDYKIWRNMLERCYCERTQEKFPTYKGCSVCDEWQLFSNFKKWFFENYIEGWELDKDIICIGNKVYSPSTCCFVPRELNSILRLSRVNDTCGIYKRMNGKYSAAIRINGENIYLGTFKSFEDAKHTRDKLFIGKVKDVVSKYEGLLPKHVVVACLNYHKALAMEKEY